MEIPARASASMRLDMSRPVLITHLAPRAWRSPMRDSTDLGIGGFSNSANSVPSKSVEISLIGKPMLRGQHTGSHRGHATRATDAGATETAGRERLRWFGVPPSGGRATE